MPVIANKKSVLDLLSFKQTYFKTQQLETITRAEVMAIATSNTTACGTDQIGNVTLV